MKFLRFLFLYSLLVLAFAACAPEMETAVSPTTTPASATTEPTATAVPSTATLQAISTPQATAVPPTATEQATAVPSPTAAIPTDPLVISPENIEQLTQLAQFGNGRIDSITWSPDGTIFAVGNSCTIDFYNSQTLKKTSAISLQDQNGIGTNHIQFSPTGEWLIIKMGGFEVDRVTLWDVASGQLIRDVYDAASTTFTADGQLVFYDWVLVKIVWQEPVSGNVIRELPVTAPPWIINLASETAAENYLDTTIRLYDLTTGELRHSLEQPDTINSAAFNLQGNLLAVGSHDGMTRLWDVASGTLLHTLPGQADNFWSLVFSEDGRLLATSSLENSVQVWDTASGQQLYELTTPYTMHTHGTPLVTFSPGGQEVAVTGSGSILFFDVATGTFQRKIDGYSYTRAIAFAPDSHSLISVNGSNFQQIEVATGELLNQRQLDQPVHAIATSPAGDFIAWGGGEQTFWLQLWQASAGQLLYTIEGDFPAIQKLLFSPDGRLLAVQSGPDWIEPVVQLLDASTGDHLLTLNANRFAFSPDGRFLASSLLYNESVPLAVEIWDVATLQHVRRLDGLALVGFSPEGNIFARLNDEGELGHWDMESGKQLPSFPTGSSLSSVHTYSPDGRLLLGTGLFGIAIWDAHTGHELWSDFGVVTGSFSLDGRFLVTINIDGIVHLWGLPAN